VVFANGKNLVLTADHPLPVEGEKGRTYVKDLEVGDYVQHVTLEESTPIRITDIERLEGWGKESFDLETETDRFDLSGVHSHNCRTRVIGNVYDPEREIVTGRGNLSFTTINLPGLALDATKYAEAIPVFWSNLEKAMVLVKEQLTDRFKIQCSKKVKNFPFLMGEGVWIDSEKLESPDDSIAEVLKHGSLSIGFIGLAETVKILTGQHHGESEEAWALGYDIIEKMRKYTDVFAKETGLNFSVLATPAEGISGRFTKIDREKYGVIEGVTDKDYYTNSFHIPVYYPISAFEKIRKEAPFHALTNAGHITYIELDGAARNNPEAFEAIIRSMKEAGIGYGSINHPVDRDPVCGYSGIIGDECPGCGRKESEGGPKFERIRRITGYLVGTLDRWNNAKRAEEADRVKHGF
jgi:ribonucleoside-triphosphate reductase